VQGSKSHNTQVGAILYQALMAIMSEEEQVGLHEDEENADGLPAAGAMPEMSKAQDVQQLLLLAKVPTFVCLVLVSHHPIRPWDRRGTLMPPLYPHRLEQDARGKQDGELGQNEHPQLASWQQCGLCALEALLVLRRADGHSAEQVAQAQGTLLRLSATLMAPDK